MSSSPRSIESLTPKEYAKALNEAEEEKLVTALEGLQVSNVKPEKPLMSTYPATKPGATQDVSTQRKAKQSTRGKSTKARTVNLQAATRKMAVEHAKSGRQSKLSTKRTAAAVEVAAAPKAESIKEANLKVVLATIPEGQRATRSKIREAVAKVPIAQRKGAKTFKKKKVGLSFEQKSRLKRQALVHQKRFGTRKGKRVELTTAERAERSRKAKEAAAKSQATRAAKEEKKKAAIEKAKATKASKKDTEME